MLSWLTAGESHGPELTAILEGMPAGVPILDTDIRSDLKRRTLGYGRGARQKFEQDELTITGGIRHGQTMGSPIALRVGNSEWHRWVDVMAAGPRDASALPAGRGAPLTKPRPGHADLVGMEKYALTDSRNILERASARETAARVALGAVARAFLAELGIALVTHTVAIGRVEAGRDDAPTPIPADVDRLDADPVRALDGELSARMVAEIDAAHADGDTLGGVCETLVYGLPPGLGSHVHWDRRLDARLAGALMSIQAIKGVEVGDGFESARRRGSEAHDEIVAERGELARVTNRAGGTEGGMSTGAPLRVRIGMKPISTVPRALRTVDVATGEAARGNHQRSDTCAVPAAGVVAEAMTALVIANAVLEKFGGDHVSETRRNLEGYLAAIPERLRAGSELASEAPATDDERELVADQRARDEHEL